MTIHVELLVAEREVEALTCEWAALAARCTAATPYNAPHWGLVWWRWRQKSGLDWRCFVARADDGSLIGVLPLVRYPDGAVRYVGHDLHDSANALAGPTVLRSLWRVAIARLHESVDCVALDLTTLADDDVTVLRDLGVDYRIPDVDPGARVVLPKTYGEYWNALSARRRKSMRWERRVLERDHGEVVFEMVDHGPELVRAVDALWALREYCWQERGRYTELAGHVRGQPLRAFLAALSNTGIAAPGPVAVARLTVRDCLAAAALLLRARQRIWYPMCAFTPALARYGPGRLLLAECVRTAIHRGLAAVELGRGVEEYKFALGAARYELPNVVVPLSA